MVVDETLQIETPEQVTLELPVAGIGSRFGALAIDTVVQIGIYILTGVLLSYGLPLVPAWAPDWLRQLGPALFLIGIFVLYWGYFSIFEIWWGGRTPGKRLASIRVIKNSGRPVRFYESMARNILRVVDFLPAFYAVGLVTMMIDRKSRRIGDFVAGTIVVHDRAEAILTTGGLTFPDLPAETDGAEAGARLTVDELRLVESYLQRRFDLSPSVADDIAGQIVKRLTAKGRIVPSPGMSNDEVLASLARTARDRTGFR